MAHDPRALHIYTDGSCYGNPGGSSGCAAFVLYPDHLNKTEEQIVDFGCEESSNNRMELMACIRALEWVRKNRPWPGVARVQLFTDSRYVIDNLLRARGWKKLKWRNQHGEPKENSDLWNNLVIAQTKTGIPVHFEWTAGKKTPILKRVDKAAKTAADRKGVDTDRGFRPGTVSRSKVKGSASRYEARGQTIVIRPYRKALAQKGEERIRFDVYSESTQAYTESCYAFAPSALSGDLHRQHHYMVRFNDNPRYPQILEIIEEMQRPS